MRERQSGGRGAGRGRWVVDAAAENILLVWCNRWIYRVIGGEVGAEGSEVLFYRVVDPVTLGGILFFLLVHCISFIFFRCCFWFYRSDVLVSS